MLSKFFSSAVVIISLLLSSGCTSLHPVELSAHELQQEIKTANLVAVDDQVNIITSDGVHLSFKVTEVTDEQIIGDKVTVQIDKVIALETIEFDLGKTAINTGLTWLSLMGLTIVTFLLI